MCNGNLSYSHRRASKNLTNSEVGFSYGNVLKGIKFGKFQEENGTNFLPVDLHIKAVGGFSIGQVMLSEWDVVEISAYLDAQRETLYKSITHLQLLNEMEKSNELWHCHLIILRKEGKIIVNEKIGAFYKSEKDFQMYDDVIVDKTETVGNILIIDVLEK